MYVYMYNIDWIRGWKIRVFLFLMFKHYMVVKHLGNWRRGTPSELVLRTLYT